MNKLHIIYFFTGRETGLMMRRLFKLTPTTIALIYILMGIAWILASDLILVRFVPELQTYRHWQSIKGLFFIFGTGLIIFMLVNSFSNRINRQKEQVKMAEEAAGLCYWFYDLNTSEIEWGEKTYALFGLSPGVELTEDLILQKIHPEDRDDLQQSVRAAIRENRSFSQDFRVAENGDSFRHLNIRCETQLNQKQEVNRLYGVIWDVSGQITREKKLEKSLEEKEVLIQEIHHRVKNNLAIISGLLQLQIFNTEDESLHAVLEESLMRIYSIALVHERLYESGNMARVSSNEYISELIERIQKTFQDDETEVTVRQDIDKIEININQAIPCVMLLNELIVNSFRHAFKGRAEGTIKITMKEEDGLITIVVKDDGVGLPSDFVLERSTTLGSKLIQLLIRQLHGNIDYEEKSSEGTTFTITFQRSDSKGSSSLGFKHQA